MKDLFHKDLFNNEPMKALSWREPYGSLMLPPFNKIETRTWNTNYRGLVLICTSQEAYSWDKVKAISGDEQFDRILGSAALFDDQPGGYAIAVGKLVDSRLMTKHDESKCFVEYREPWEVINKKGKRVIKKLYCHVYEDVLRIKPIPWKGSQGWKDVPDEIMKQIEFI